MFLDVNRPSPCFKIFLNEISCLFSVECNKMDPNDVLKRFLDVCSNKDDKCTRYAFASNGVMEWFGRNVKDNNKIFEYIR